MPSLELTALFELPSTLTRRLRDKTKPLLELLDDAESILKAHNINTYIPQHEEWILEWLVERLSQRTGKGESVEYPGNPRLSSKSWNVLYDSAVSCKKKGNLAALSSTLRKHDLFGLLNTTLTEAVDDIRSKQTIPAPCDLLNSLLRFVEFIFYGENVSVTEIQPNNSKRRKVGNSALSLRGTPELGSIILGSYLTFLRHILETKEHPELQIELWTDTFLEIFKSCVYGSVNVQKISSSVSSYVLFPAAIILVHPAVPENSRLSIAKILKTYVFCSLNDTTSAEASMSRALSPLETECSPKETEAIISALQAVLKLGIERKWSSPAFPLNRSGSEAYASLVFRAISRLYSSRAEVTSELLDVLISTKQTLDEAAAKEVASNATAGSLPPRWGILRRLAILSVTPLLPYLDTLPFEFRSASVNDDMWEYLALSIDGFARLRNFSAFLNIWRKRLRTASSDDQNCVWYHEKLQKLVAQRIESALNAHQLSRIVSELSISMGDCEVVILDSLLRGISQRETVETLRKTNAVASLYSRLTEEMQGQHTDISWRKWRLFLRVSEIWGFPEGAFDASAFVRSSQISKVIKQKFKPGHPEDVLQVFFMSQATFAVVSIGGDSSAWRMETMKGLVSSIRASLASSGVGAWNGTIEGITDVSTLALAVLFMMAGRWMDVVSWCEGNDDVEKLLGLVVQNAMKASPRNEKDTITANQVWQVITGCLQNYEIPGFKDFVLAVILKECQPVSEGSVAFFLSTVETFPTDSLTRTQRESLLNQLLDFLAAKGFISMGRQIQLRLMRSVSGIMDYFSQCSRLTNVDANFGLPLIFCSPTALEEDLVSEKVSIGRKRVRQIITTRDSSHLESCLEKLTKATRADLSKKSREASINAIAMSLAVVTEVIPACHKDEFAPYKRAATELRDLATDFLVKSLQTHTDPNKSFGLGWHLDMIRAFLELDSEKEKLSMVKVQLENLGNLSGVVSSIAQYGLTANHSRTLQSIFRLQCMLGASADDILNTTSWLAILLENSLNDHTIAENFHSLLEKASPDDYCFVLAEVRRSCRSEESDKSLEIRLDVLKLVISFRIAEDNKISNYLSTAFGQLLQQLLDAKKFTSFQQILEIVDVILREKPWAVSQFNVDELLTVICSLASTSGSDPHHANADDIYTLLCCAIMSVLQFHWHRLRGRYHLLVGALKCLLRCLFSPRSSARRKTERSIHPQWIEFGGGENEQQQQQHTRTCTASSALFFSRLLRMICDPSVSSVKQNRKEASLSSSVVAAKKAVSIHVSHVLTEFISLHLQYELKPEIKAELSSGLYSIFDAIGPELLKSINASLDNHGRVLFKGLYDEWGRHGKWNE